MSFRYESIYFDRPIRTGRVMDIFSPENISREISLFFIHGGGWFGGTRTCHHALMQAFNARGYLCASTDYRLAGGKIHLNDQMTDLRHAYDIFSRELQNTGRPQKIVAFGSSAGAHLAALLSFSGPGELGESDEYAGIKLNKNPGKPAGAVLHAAPFLFEPWEDIFPPIWASMEKLMGEPYCENPEFYSWAAPITHVTPGTPPVFYMHAENEYIFPLRYFLKFKEKMDASGARCEYKTYTNAEHGFFYDITRRQQKEAFSDMLAFLKSLEE